MKADLHLHTNFSFDGLSSPKEVVRAAIEKGIDCICITDHKEVRGAIEAMKFAFDKSILVIPGIEIKTKLGDILGINVKKIIPDNLSLEETVKKIKEQGGLAVIAHPFQWPIGNFRGKEKEFLTVGAVEAFNANLFDFSNKRALDFAQKHNFLVTAGSDAHFAEFIGRGYLEISKENILSEKDILEEIINKRIKIQGKNFNFKERIKDNLTKKVIRYFYDFLSKK